MSLLNITRFQFYLLCLIFGMGALLLLQTGMPSSWNWKLKNSGSHGKDVSRHHYNLRKNFQRIRQRTYIANEDDAPWSYERFIDNMTKIAVEKKSNRKEFNSIMSRAFHPLNSLPIIPESNMTRVLVVTYFRAGSTFLGDLLQQNWKSFYTFEPLHYMTTGVRIHESDLEKAINLIYKILKCDFSHAKRYANWVKQPQNQFLFKWNRFLSSICRFRSITCYDTNFLSETCIRAKVHIMKIVRLHMRHIKLLIDRVNDLNIKIVYLVRDPRGTLSSRKSLAWCNKHFNCTDVDNFCSEMREDLAVFKSIIKQTNSTSKYLLMRYEDLALNPTEEAKQLFNKLGIPFSPTVKRFLKTHTNATKVDPLRRNPYTTKRNSKSIAFEWRQKLNMSDIIEIQDKCGDLLTQFGYKFVDTQSISNDNQTNIHLNDISNSVMIKNFVFNVNENENVICKEDVNKC